MTGPSTGDMEYPITGVSADTDIMPGFPRGKGGGALSDVRFSQSPDPLTAYLARRRQDCPCDVCQLRRRGA